MLALRIRALLLLFVGLVAPARRASAQGAGSDGDKTFLRASDLAVAGAFALGSFAISRVDPAIAEFFQRPEHQHDGRLRTAANAFTRIQETTLTLGGLATYGIARLAGSRDVQEVALHATEAIAAASLTSQVIRGPLGRARPKDATPMFEDQYEFHWFNGFGNFKYRAYPSIHSSSAFAAATVLLAETHRRSPRSTWYVAPLAAIIASGPGYSRMYLGQHWASDIFMGAFLGTFYGLRVVDYTHAHPENRVDRFFIPPRAKAGLSLVPQAGRVTVAYTAVF